MADQNIFGTFGKAKELRQRILFTLGALIIYRLGTYIPVPGINPTVLNEIVNQTSGGVLGMFNMFSGGALGRMTIFALTIIPYISASIIMQLMTSLSPQIAQLKKELVEVLVQELVRPLVKDIRGKKQDLVLLLKVLRVARCLFTEDYLNEVLKIYLEQNMFQLI